MEERPEGEAVVDEELVALRPASRPRSPLTALAVIGLAAVLSWHLRADLTYAFRARSAVDLGDARTLFSRGAPLADNSYVTVRGQPDRRNALAIEPTGGRERQSFFRLLGTGTRLLVRALPSDRGVRLDERWTGRLRRFDALPYSPSLREYYAEKVRAARYLALDAFHAALAQGRFEGLQDRTGEPLTLTPSTDLTVDVLFPDQLQVVLTKEKFPSEPDARHELERLGLKPTALDESADDYEYMVAAPAAQRNAVVAKLDERGIQFAADARRFTARLDELRLDRDPLRLDHDTLRLPKVALQWSVVQSVSLDAPIHIADEAFVLSEGESPEAFWWAPALLLLLLAFAGFNVWYLARGRRS